MQTIVLELVPPDLEQGAQRAVEEGHKAAENARAAGLADTIQHVMMPGIIAEDDDRPVEMKQKMDVKDFWTHLQTELPGHMKGMCTQVTAFHDKPQLTDRLQTLRSAGMEGIVFVGVPRTMSDGEGSGVAPTDALAEYGELVPNRGVIMIPTRDSEQGRFNFKCNQGATFAMTQLLYSDAIVDFLRNFAKETSHRPEILLSFGHIPAAETRVGLLQWLIQDPGNEVVRKEQEFIARAAEGNDNERRRTMVELYKRVVDGVGELGFPLSIHLEAPYGPSKASFDTFAEMLDYWSPTA